MVTKSKGGYSDAVFEYYLSDTFALYSFSLHFGEVMVECDNIGDDGFLIWELHIDICKEKKISSEAVFFLPETNVHLTGKEQQYGS